MKIPDLTYIGLDDDDDDDNEDGDDDYCHSFFFFFAGKGSHLKLNKS